ncbi:MAG: UDP-4-amino-4,6-dideoxy-N-acetyl-beta-L-altrosamine transaminase, partial [Planctomycetota bacterium]
MCPISYGRQSVDNSDIQCVVEVLNSDWLTQGPNVVDFEGALCQKFGSQYASVLSSGTAALHLAGLALGWKTGDIVLTTPITFLASANCILYAGATPDFVDIGRCSYTIDIEKLETKLKEYDTRGQKVKAVVAVDYAGRPCDWYSLRQLADKYEFQLVDDACHAIGAMYKNSPIGSSRYADVTVFSFHPVKHITTGEGGAVLTDSMQLDKKIKMLRMHGITKDEKLLESNDGPWYYEMHELGFNYRITDIQCALGLSQLKKLDQFIERRRQIAAYYDDCFAKDDRFIVPAKICESEHAYHLYPLQINFDDASVAKDVFFQQMRQRNIFCQVHYIPVHLQPYYRTNFGFAEGDFPVSEEFYKR